MSTRIAEDSLTQPHLQGKTPNGTTEPLKETMTREFKSEGVRQRVQLDFSPEAFSRLEEVRELAGAKTNSEIIRNAVRVYEWFLRQQRAGFKIQLANEDTIKEVELLI